MHIGDRIRTLRRAQRLTQVDLAQRAFISQALISRLERHRRGNVHADVLKGLALALGCTADYLLGMHEDADTDRLSTEACGVSV